MEGTLHISELNSAIAFLSLKMRLRYDLYSRGVNSMSLQFAILRVGPEGFSKIEYINAPVGA